MYEVFWRRDTEAMLTEREARLLLAYSMDDEEMLSETQMEEVFDLLENKFNGYGYIPESSLKRLARELGIKPCADICDVEVGC